MPGNRDPIPFEEGGRVIVLFFLLWLLLSGEVTLRVCVWGAMGLILILTLTEISSRKWFHIVEMGEYLLAICATVLLRIGKRRARP